MSKATAIFEADDSRLGAALTRINQRMLALQARIAKFAVAFVAVRAAARVVTAGFDHMRQALDLGGELNDLSANTGVAVGDLVILQQEFANAGKSAEDLGPTLAKMTRSLQGGTADDAVRRLGLSLEDLKAKTPAEQFRALGTAINAVENPSERAAMAMAIFGKSGSELLAVFGSNGFGEASQQLGSQAQLLARDAALFDDVCDKLALTGVKVRGFWIGLADKVAPVLKPLLDKFASLDLAKMGQDFGEIVAFIMQAFADGKMGDILWTSAKIALAKIANTVVGLFTALGQALITTLIEGVKTVLTLLSIATSADFWIGMGYSMLAAAKNFIAFVEEGFAKIFDGMRDWWFIGDGAGEAADGLKQDAADWRKSANDSSNKAAAHFEEPFNRASTRFSEAIGNISSAVADGFEQGSSLIDTSDWQAHLDDSVDSVMRRVQSVSDTARASVESEKPKGVPLLPEEEEEKPQKASRPAVSALQRIGGGGAAVGNGDPMLREQQRQTRELTTQTGLLRDVKRVLENKTPTKTPVGVPAFS
jgi:hypothetical protein